MPAILAQSCRKSQPPVQGWLASAPSGPIALLRRHRRIVHHTRSRSLANRWVCQRGRPAACSLWICGQRPGREHIFPQTQAFALEKTPEMTCTPSFLIKMLPAATCQCSEVASAMWLHVPVPLEGTPIRRTKKSNPPNESPDLMKRLPHGSAA